MGHATEEVTGRLRRASRPSGRAKGLDWVWTGSCGVARLGVMAGSCGIWTGAWVWVWAGQVGGLADWPETSSGGRERMAKARYL